MGGNAISSAVGDHSRSGGGSTLPSHLQHVCGFCAVSFWHWRQPSVKFSRTIARCFSNAACSSPSPGNWTPCIFGYRTVSPGSLSMHCISCSVVCETLPVIMLAIFNARSVSDSSICSWPPYQVLLPHMLKRTKKSIPDSEYKIELRHLQYSLQPHYGSVWNPGPARIGEP
jgi:hypothetical protein